MSTAVSATKPENGPADAHGKYHQCECYGHDVQLPNYRKDISKPRTLQGYYAPQGGCPCPSKKAGASGCAGCTKTQQSGNGVTGCSTYRTAAGEHMVLPATSADEATAAAVRDPKTGARTVFPNARNYGGTVSQRGPTTLASSQLPRSAQASKREAKKVEALQDRKAFLKAVLRDEMLARMDAEAEREALEHGTGLIGANHVVDYEATHGAGTLSGKATTKSMSDRGIHDVPTVAEQYAEVMDELEYVAGQPVGSKFNIIRLHYLVEEENRVNALRHQQKMQSRTESCKKSVA